MPLSEIQSRVLRLLAANRSEESYLAGATVINRSETSVRFSQDVDLFHDVLESVARTAEEDVRILVDAGYAVEWVLRTPRFQRLIVGGGTDRLLIEWAQDSAFRFFPLQRDDLCGWRLHDADAATNKVLALAGRSEIRDFVDLLSLHNDYLSLGTLAWAACGKDLGFTPDFLLDYAARHVAYTQADLNRLALRRPLDLCALKRNWLDALEKARSLVLKLPSEEAGCFYLDEEGHPVDPEPDAGEFPRLVRHYGCLRGSWPTVERTTDE